MPPLTILQIANRIPYPLNDGGNIATFELARHLRESGNKVSLASLNTSKHYFDPDKVPEVYDQKLIHYIDNRITVQGALKGLFQKLPYNIARFYDGDFETKLGAFVKENHFDIIQVEGIYLALYIDVLRKNTDAKIVLRSHNIEYQIWERVAEKDTSLPKKMYLEHLKEKTRKFEEQRMHEFDAIVAITENDAAFYKEKNYFAPLTTINAGVNIPENTDLPKKNNLCIFGSLEWIPNVQGLQWFLKNCWPQISQKHPAWNLNVAGKNPPAEVMKIQEKGVTILGEVADADQFLEDQEIVLVPLLSGGGMRLKVLEAMSKGKAVVSTYIGAEGIPCRDNENIFLAETADEFISKTLILLASKEKREEIGRNAASFAKDNFSWKQKAHEFVQFYNTII